MNERKKTKIYPPHPTHTLFIETYKRLYRVVGSAGELAESRMFNLLDESKRMYAYVFIVNTPIDFHFSIPVSVT